MYQKQMLQMLLLQNKKNVKDVRIKKQEPDKEIQQSNEPPPVGGGAAAATTAGSWDILAS